jgi:hypothetical protein
MPKDIGQIEAQKWQGYLTAMNFQGELQPINKEIIERYIQKLQGKEIAPENPKMSAIVSKVAGNCVEIKLPEKGTVYRLSFIQIIQSEKIILYWLHQQKAPMFKDFKEPDSSIGAPSIAHSSYTPALAERIRREMCGSSTDLRISKRIKDSIDVLRLIRDLFLKDETIKIAKQRKKAIEIISDERRVADRTIIAHLLGKNIPSKLSTIEFDSLLKEWLNNDSDKLKKWYMKHANHSEIVYISNFFDQPNFLYSPLASDISNPSETTRIETTTYRIVRDTALSRTVKISCQFKCQLCGNRIQLSDGSFYAEAHHVKPLGNPHNGPDIKKNIMVVCPNCHVLLDYKVIKLEESQVPHIAKEYIDYHNFNI